jgi:hypothetical protein
MIGVRVGLGVPVDPAGTVDRGSGVLQVRRSARLRERLPEDVGDLLVIGALRSGGR